MCDDHDIIDSKISQFVGIANVDVETAASYLESVAWNFEYALERYFKHEGTLKFDLKSRITEEEQNLSNQQEDVSYNIEGTTLDSYYGETSTAYDQRRVANTDVITKMVATDHKSVDLLLANNSKNDSSGAQKYNVAKSLGSYCFERHIYYKPPGKTVSTCFYEVVLKIWRNGVILNDGEFYNISRDEILKILQDFDEKKRIPSFFKSKLHIFDDDALHVKVVDHRREIYIPTEPKKTVEESRNSSNSCATKVVDIEVSTKTSSDNKIIDTAAARVQVPLVPGVPTTPLRIKLLDGTKLNAKFNLTHTVGDIRRYIIAARSNYECSPFKLKASYPPKILDKNSQTLMEAGILNSIIYQYAG